MKRPEQVAYVRSKYVLEAAHTQTLPSRVKEEVHDEHRVSSPVVHAEHLISHSETNMIIRSGNKSYEYVDNLRRLENTSYPKIRVDPLNTELSTLIVTCIFIQIE